MVISNDVALLCVQKSYVTSACHLLPSGVNIPENKDMRHNNNSGEGVDSVSYPGPSIHPIMSLKIYILLYIYYYGMN